MSLRLKQLPLQRCPDINNMAKACFCFFFATRDCLRWVGHIYQSRSQYNCFQLSGCRPTRRLMVWCTMSCARDLRQMRHASKGNRREADIKGPWAEKMEVNSLEASSDLKSVFCLEDVRYLYRRWGLISTTVHVSLKRRPSNQRVKTLHTDGLICFGGLNQSHTTRNTYEQQGQGQNCVR